MTFDFDAQREEWVQIPVDDVGYFSSRDLLAKDDGELRAIVEEMERVRYTGWRNHGGRWRGCMGLDDTTGKVVLDFGCGLGVEALQFARAGNEVLLADINGETRRLGARVLGLYGYDAETVAVEGTWPFLQPSRSVDVFYANGVLHHTPEAPAILKRATELLAPGGLVRLMLYTDRGWRHYMDSEPPCSDPREHEDFWRFVREFDAVGSYAEPWWPEKLQGAAEGLELVSWDYLTDNDRYAAAVLRCALVSSG